MTPLLDLTNGATSEMLLDAAHQRHRIEMVRPFRYGGQLADI